MRVLVALDMPDDEREQLLKEFQDPHFEFAPGGLANRDDLDDFQAIYARRINSNQLARASSLRWLHVPSAGVNHLPLAGLRERGLSLTNGRGAHGVPVAETALAMIFAFAIRLPTLLALQARCEWEKEAPNDSKLELEGQSLLIAGLGDIGATLARKASGLGMRVIGLRRRGGERPAGVERLIRPGEWRDALEEADHVALCLPLTRETDGFFGEREMRAMKRTAFLYNVGRGRSVDQAALITALREGWIAGAGLDVTDPEPIPPDDPIWHAPNVILTQHTSGASPHNASRITALFRDNLRRFLSGEPLLNTVDMAAGY